MGFPGQRETRRSDSKSDYILPLKQWGAAIVLITLSFLLIVANVLIIGPLVGYVVGVITFLLAALYGYAIVHGQEQPIPALVAIVGLVLLGFWIIAGYGITDRFWWDARCNWEPRNKLLFVTFSSLFLICTTLPIYRFAQEVVDPNWSPTITIRPAEWGVLWPWFKPPSEEPEVIEVEREVVKEVPRPVPSNGHKAIVDNLDAQRVNNNSDKTVMAPSGRQAKVKNLVTFIRQSPIHGTSYNKVWKKRKWDYDTWCDVVDVWARYGVLSERKDRTPTKILISDFTKAMELLSSAFD